MAQTREANLKLAIKTYESLIEIYTRKQGPLRSHEAERGGAVDVRLSESQRTLEGLRAAVRIASRELKELAPEEAAVERA